MSTHTPPPIVPPLPPFGTIPPWTLSGVLPPYLGDPRLSTNMAPYPTTLQHVVDRFAKTPERKTILQGFLAYRAALASIGLDTGFQWLNGSILEDIEKIEARNPRDIDIIVFFRRPAIAKDPIAWASFFSHYRVLFSPAHNKATYYCDTQYVDLDAPAEDVASLTRFWFGLFSHRRDGMWKGMLTVPLAISADDAVAAALLSAPPVGGSP